MASLPDLPKDHELEWSVAAALQSSGFYIEQNVTDRFEGSDVLELDVIATRYTNNQREEALIEVKSGRDWRFNDIFALRGKMQYRNIKTGVFFVTQCSADRLEAYTRVAKQLGITFIYCADAASLGIQAALASAEISVASDESEHDFWRFAYWAERNFISCIDILNKSESLRSGLSKKAKKYYLLINDRLFFETNDLRRASALYRAYSETPKLSLDAATESNANYLSCLKDGSNSLVQACLYLENRARLATLRAAVDFVCYGNSADKKNAWRMAGLPSTFLTAITDLQEDPHAHLYPYFWQVYFWSFGAFILTKSKDKEYAELSKQTGVPVDSIDRAFALYGKLFPFPKGCFQTHSSDEIISLKMVPPAINGLGAFHRLFQTANNDYDELECGSAAVSRLVNVHNTALALIERTSHYAITE